MLEEHYASPLRSFEFVASVQSSFYVYVHYINDKHMKN